MSRGQSDSLDLDSSATGFETAAFDDIIPAGDISSAVSEQPTKRMGSNMPVQSVRSPWPPRNAHPDEVIRLRRELEKLREEQGQAEEMVYLMGEDLQRTQEEVEEKDDELRRREAELLKCREELRNWRQNAQNLSNEIQEEKRLAADKVANLTTSLATKDEERREAKLKGEEELSSLRRQVEQLTADKEAQTQSIGSQSTTELVDLRKQVTQLKSTISEKDAELTKKAAVAADSLQMGENTNQEQELRHAAEASLRTTKEEYEVKLREADQRAGVQLAEMQKRAQAAENSLQEHTSRVQDVGSDQDKLQKRIHGLESELQDQRKCCAWFKRNSERLSREIKEAEAARRQMEQSEYAVKRQVADLKSQVNALQSRRGMGTMPGAY